MPLATPSPSVETAPPKFSTTPPRLFDVLSERPTIFVTPRPAPTPVTVSPAVEMRFPALSTTFASGVSIVLPLPTLTLPLLLPVLLPPPVFTTGPPPLPMFTTGPVPIRRRCRPC